MTDSLFVSWSVAHGRSRDLAIALGAEAVFVGVRNRRRRWLTPLRYVMCTAVTVGSLATRRPRSLYVMAPPLPLTVLAVLYGRLRRCPVAVDAHTGAVLAMRSGRLRFLPRMVERLATVTIVTNDELATLLRDHGIGVVTLHDALPTVAIGAARPAFDVVAPLAWAPDEPVDAIVEAARTSPGVRFALTGNAPAAFRERTDLPANLELVGFLPVEEYEALVSGAGVVLALTTRAATMQRAGYEALARALPVVASDTTALRACFQDAALYATTADDIARAVAEIQTRRARFVAAMERRRDEMRSEFEAAIAEVLRRMRP